jgi:hypothetical protein
MIGSLNGRGAVDRAPDGTIDSPGVQIEALTAAAAEPQAQKMNEVPIMYVEEALPILGLGDNTRCGQRLHVHVLTLLLTRSA